MRVEDRWHRDLWPILRLASPGTTLREGLENVLRAKTGGLILIGDGPEVRSLCEGGFLIDDTVTAGRLYELAKMDGAIVLDEKGETIWKANVHLQPSLDWTSEETGIRHRVAARVAAQTGVTIFAVSQRRSMITIFSGTQKFVLLDIEALLVRANQALQTLERYSNELKKDFDSLSLLEFDGIASVNDFIRVIQQGEMIKRIVEEIDYYLLQMGDEGRLTKMQRDEVTNEVLPECHHVILDYAPKANRKTVTEIESALSRMEDDDITDKLSIAKLFGYGGSEVLERPAFPRGYRILGRIPRLPSQVIDNIVKYFDNDFLRIINATVEELDEVDGIGPVRSKAIYRGLQRQRDYAELNGHNRLF